MSPEPLDDFWADDVRLPPKNSVKLGPPIRCPRGREDWNASGDASEDDSWADLPRRSRKPQHDLEEPQRSPKPEQDFSDAWADTLPSRQGTCGQKLASTWLASSVGFLPELENDSWADQAPSKVLAVREVASETSAAARDVMATSGSLSMQVVSGMANTSTSTETHEAAALTKADSQKNNPMDATTSKPCQAEHLAKAAPDVPEEYCTFAGRVMEFHASDESAGAAFAEQFCLERFRAQFPHAEGQPLLVGLDFEWKPDRKPGDNNPIALMQLACWDTAFILRTTDSSAMPAWLSEFLESGDDFIKVTASFDVADRHKLLSSFGWDFDEKANASSFVDIAELAVERNIPYGMLKMAKFFNVPMLKLKAVGSSNWAREAGLTPQQRTYAADDAFFQLYLLGKLLEQRLPESAVLKQCLKSWHITQEAMEKCKRQVDNSAYRRCFFELREVVHHAVDVLSKALGSGGCTNINDLNRFKSVQKTVTAMQRTSPISLNAQFLRQNSDIFVIFHRDGQMRVRLRQPDESDDEDAEEAPCPEDISPEESAKLVAEVQELLVKYEPPVEKRRTVLHRNIPEAFWVPARAILTRQQTARLELCLKECSDSVESSYDAEDGILLRLVRHPRAADDAEHMEASVKSLSAELSIPEDEAKQRFAKDEKFMQFWSLLRTVEVNSPEEASIARCLRARSRILADSQRLGVRVSVTWEEAREGLEKVKWYRSLLGDCLGGKPRADLETKVEECIGAVALAWPNVKDVLPPNRQKRVAQDEAAPPSDQKRRKQEGGKGKRGGKSKGKGKSSRGGDTGET